METLPNFGLYHGKDNVKMQKRIHSHLRSPIREISPKQNPRTANKKHNAIVEEIE